MKLLSILLIICTFFAKTKAQNYIITTHTDHPDTIYYDTVRMFVYIIGTENHKYNPPTIYPKFVIPLDRLSENFSLADYLRQICKSPDKSGPFDSVFFFKNSVDFINKKEFITASNKWYTLNPHLRNQINGFVNPPNKFPILEPHARNFRFANAENIYCPGFRIYFMDAKWLRFRLKCCYDFIPQNHIQLNLDTEYSTWYLFQEDISTIPLTEIKNQGLK